MAGNWNGRSNACQVEENSYIVCEYSVKKTGCARHPVSKL